MICHLQMFISLSYMFSTRYNINGSLNNHCWSYACEITHPFTNLNSASIDIWERISNFIPHYLMEMITVPSIKTIQC